MSRFKTKKIPKNPSLPPLSSVRKKTKTETLSAFSQKKIPSFSTKNTEPQKKQHSRTTKKLIGFLFIVASLLFMGHFVLHTVGNINISLDDEHKIFQAIHTGSNAQQEQEVKNILIAGIGGRGHPGGELTDSIIFAHLDPKNKEVTMVSIPRDFYVAYSKNTAGKINALYPIGQKEGVGVNMLTQKVAEIMGQPIHHYIIIDFSGFQSIVDALGGVEVDVPKAIYDNQYPNSTWGYQVFSLPQGRQTLDGATALKFARSRYSTSDFDRSHRQQLLIQAIKDKALSLGIITNPTRIGDIIHSVRSNISTDLTVGDIVNFGLTFKDIDNSNIKMYGLNDICSGATCMPWSYLYTPSKEYFGGAWALIPEGASMNKLTTYGHINMFTHIILQFPNLPEELPSISIVSSQKNMAQARLIRKHLMQIGFPVEYNSIITQTGAVEGNTRITAYYQEFKTASGETRSAGFTKDTTIIRALQALDTTIPLTFASQNEYVRDQGPRIEIILGDDIKNFFPSMTQATYLPTKTSPSHDNTNTSTETSIPTVTNKEATTADTPVSEESPTETAQTETLTLTPHPTPSTTPPVTLPSEETPTLPSEEMQP